MHGSPEAVATMASEANTQSRVMFEPAGKVDEPGPRKLGKLTVKYNRKDLQRRLDIEEWIDEQLHLLFDCEVRRGGGTHTSAYTTRSSGGRDSISIII